MRVLFISNFYPPYQIGGYEMLCMEVADALADRGCEVTVLTSTHGVDRELVEGHVYRLLSLEGKLDFYRPGHTLRYPMANKRNLRHLRHLMDSIQPDIVFIWGMWCLSKQLPREAERILRSRVVYYLANPWPIEPCAHRVYWDQPARRPWRRFAKRLARILARVWLNAEWQSVPLEFRYAPCCSRALRDQLLTAGVPLRDAPVIYEGIDLDPYVTQADRRDHQGNKGKLTLLFVGILAAHKGVHTAIEALTHLSPIRREQTGLTILGTGHPAYETRLQNLVTEHGLSNHVSFHAPIPRTKLPEYLGRHDVLLLPSIWEEPMARIMQEGLASGMVVIGSATGGTKEIIVNGDNGLLFPPDDAPALAGHIDRLITDSSLRQSLAANGKRTAIKHFEMRRMVDEIETYLERVRSAAV